MNEIFISYRREDSQHIVGRIYDYLSSQYKKNSVFMDVDSIPDGKNFKKIIENSIKSSKVILVIIGNKWVDLTDEYGNKRIFKENDFVRLEIEVALKYDIPIIPILVNDATMPTEEELPQSIKSISLNNARMIRADPDFHDDIKKLVNSLDLIIKRINLKRRKYLLGTSLFLVTMSVLGLIYFKVVKPYLDVANIQAQEKRKISYLENIKKGKKAFFDKQNNNLAKHFFAHSIALSNNKTDELYAKKFYFKIPSIIFTKKNTFYDIEKFKTTSLNSKNDEIVFCYENKLEVWNLINHQSSLSVDVNDSCEKVMVSEDNKLIIMWNNSEVYIIDKSNGKIIKKILFDFQGEINVKVNKESNILIIWNYNKLKIFDLQNEIFIGNDLLTRINQKNKLSYPHDTVRELSIKYIILLHSKIFIATSFYVGEQESYSEYNIFYNFKNNIINESQLNKDAKFYHEAINLSSENNFIALCKTLKKLKVYEIKNKHNHYTVTTDDYYLNSNSIIFKEKKVFLLYRKFFEESTVGGEAPFIISILNLDNLTNGDDFLFIYPDNINIEFTNNFIGTFDKHGIYTKYSLQHEELDKEDYILRTEIGTGQRLTSSGDLIDIDELELKNLKEKYIKKYGKYD